MPDELIMLLFVLLPRQASKLGLLSKLENAGLSLKDVEKLLPLGEKNARTIEACEVTPVLHSLVEGSAKPPSSVLIGVLYRVRYGVHRLSSLPGCFQEDHDLF